MTTDNGPARRSAITHAPDALSVGESRQSGPLGLSWPLIVVAVLFPLVLIRAHSRLLADGDVYWHLAVGRWIIEHRTVPAFDVFSFSMAGAPWTAHEWLAEVLYAAAYAAGGWTAVVSLAVAAVVAAMAVLTRYLLVHLEPIVALCLTAAAFSLVAPHLLARPHVLAMPLIVLWSVGLVRAREAGRAPPWFLAVLMVPWANLHGSFPLGLALAATFATEAVIAATGFSSRSRIGRDWAVFLLLALGAALLTPHGVSGLRFVFDVHGMEYAMDHIGEWRSPNFHEFQPLELWLLVAAAFVFTRGLRLPLVRLVVVLGLLHLGLRHQRHIELLGLLGPIVIAESLGAQWLAGRDRTKAQAVRLDRLMSSLSGAAKPIALAAVIVWVAVVAWTAERVDAERPAPAITPEAAVRAALAANPLGPVLNQYDFGGYLIFAGVPSFIDGRADLYGDTFFANYINGVGLLASDRFNEIIERYQIGWTLFSPTAPVVALLDCLPGWRRIYADGIAVVHVRERIE